MSDTPFSLPAKDGNGTIRTLSSITGSNGIATHHALTGTIADSISGSLHTIASVVSGNVLQTNRIFATGSAITRHPASNLYNGTGVTIPTDSNRTNLIILNRTDGTLYLTIGGTGDLTTNSERFTYILTLSGNYYAEQTDVRLSHHLTSSNLNGYVLVTETKY